MVYALLDTGGDLVCIQSSDVHPWKDFRVQYHWLDASFVGAQFARECTEWHYENNMYVFIGDAVRTLPSHLTTDFCGNGVIPIDNLRTVYVELDRHVEKLKRSAEPQDVVHLERAVKSLLELKHRSSARILFTIHMDYSSKIKRLVQLAYHLTFLIPALHCFKAAGLEFDLRVHPLKGISASLAEHQISVRSTAGGIASGSWHLAPPRQ